MRVQLHRKCVGEEEEGRGWCAAAGESRGERGNKENNYEGNEYEWDWVDGRDRESNRSEESWDEVSILN